MARFRERALGDGQTKKKHENDATDREIKGK